MPRTISKPEELDPRDALQFDADFRRLFDVIPDVHFFIKDRSGRLIYCNATHEHALFRFPAADGMYGKTNFDFFPGTLAAAFEEDDRLVMESGKPLMERIELNMTKSGHLHWFCTSKTPARNHQGNIVGLVGISRRLHPADERLAEHAHLSPAITYIQQHITEQIRLADLAHKCGISETTFRRDFKRLFRQTPIKFLNRLRIHEACSQLSAGVASVGDVARNCGYDDQNYFARQFRSITGTSPTEFRRLHCGKTS